MGTKYVARLQWAPDGPAVEGEWAAAATAEGRYTEWVGRYGSTPTVIIRLIEETDGCERVLKTWTAQGEVAGPPVP